MIVVENGHAFLVAPYPIEFELTEEDLVGYAAVRANLREVSRQKQSVRAQQAPDLSQAE